MNAHIVTETTLEMLETAKAEGMTITGYIERGARIYGRDQADFEANWLAEYPAEPFDANRDDHWSESIDEAIQSLEAQS